MKKYYIGLVLAIIVAPSCQRTKDSRSNQEYYVEGDTICISQQSPLIKKLKIEKTSLQSYCPVFTASGVVQAIPSNYAKIASPFSGRITKSFIHLGQKISAGSPIFEISSPDFYEAVKNYFQAKQETRAAYINLLREKDLVNNKVGAVKDLEETELDYEMKKKNYENAKAALSVYHLSPQQLVLGKPLVVRSPIAGEVVENNIVIGQYLKDDAEPIATVANLNKVWMVAHVKEKDINMIRSLSSVGITLVSMPEKEIQGRIFNIGQLMDEDTHSVKVIIECNNSGKLMKPGMYGNVKLSDKSIQKILLPSSAILQEENYTYVYVRTDEGKYVKRQINIVTVPDKKVAVISGLNAGEYVITKGAFYLNDIL